MPASGAFNPSSPDQLSDPMVRAVNDLKQRVAQLESGQSLIQTDGQRFTLSTGTVTTTQDPATLTFVRPVWATTAIVTAAFMDHATNTDTVSTIYTAKILLQADTLLIGNALQTCAAGAHATATAVGVYNLAGLASDVTVHFQARMSAPTSTVYEFFGSATVMWLR